MHRRGPLGQRVAAISAYAVGPGDDLIDNAFILVVPGGRGHAVMRELHAH